MKETEIFARIRGAGLRGVGDFQEGAKDPALYVERDNLLGVLRFLRHDDDCAMDMLHNVSAVERVDAFEVWYHLCSLEKHHSITLYTSVPKPEGEEITDDWRPSVPSAVPIYQSADWHEREQYDLLGVVFEGHPDLRRILLPEEWIGFPLRKNYVYPQEHGGVPLELDAKPMYERAEGEAVTTGAPPRPAGEPLNQPPSDYSKRPHAGGKAPPKEDKGDKAGAAKKSDGDDAEAKAAKLAAIKAKMKKGGKGKDAKSDAKAKDAKGEGGKAKGDKAKGDKADDGDKQGKDG